MNEYEQSLNGSWLLAWDQQGQGTRPTTLEGIRASGLPTAPGQVPGNFELDLERAGVLPELFMGQNILLVQAYERATVFYGRSFRYDRPVTGREELLLEGVDTYADFYLNGRLIGSTDNALIPHRLPLPGLRQGENELVCVLRSCLAEAGSHPVSVGDYALHYNYASLRVRKAPSAYGWDIMPRTVSCGLWRGVSLILAPEARIEQAYLYTASLEAGRADLRLFYELRLPQGQDGRYRLHLSARCGDSALEHTFTPFWQAGQEKLSLPSPRLWWPRGQGEPNLYDCRLTLYHGDTVADERAFTLGVRTVELSRTSLTDEAGSGDFCFVINGRRVFLLGTNWVPADAFHSRDEARIPAILQLAWDSGVNCLRCWGGNVYEDHAFFAECDRRGLVVWQDFAMACGLYPQDDAFAAALRTEAVAIVRRLRQHPSLILWSGDNECDRAAQWSGSGRDPNGNRLTRRVLPEVVASEDACRPYLPSSPYIDEAAQAAGALHLPEDHLWGPRDYYKSAFYLGSTAHFASEMGYHGCPHPASIRRFIPQDALWPWQGNADWLIHAASPQADFDGPYAYRIGLMARQAELLVGPGCQANLNDFALASQLSQAEAMKFFIERFRSQRGRRTGLIWWNIMDGWPQFSDAVVDYYGTKKLAFYAIAASSRPLQLMADEEGCLLALNDTAQRRPLTYRVKELWAGDEVCSGS
ncbi:MAG: glycoside hydrolase family 2 protein, partial [Christensenellaceae bacterium]